MATLTPLTGGDGQPGSQTGLQVRTIIDANLNAINDELEDTEEFDPATKANVASPTLTGTPLTPTAAPGTNTTQIASTAFVTAAVTLGSGGASIATLRTSKYQYFTDFMNLPQSSSTAGSPTEMLITAAGVGSGSAMVTASTVGNRPGVLRLNAGTTSTGYASLHLGVGASGQFKLGTGAVLWEADVKIPVLSTAGERFAVKVGVFADINALNELDGVEFLYDEGGVATGSAASGNWQIVSCQTSTRTYTTTSTTIVLDTWYKLRIEVNAAGTSVAFYINGALAGTHTANIPTGARSVGLGMTIIKSVGSTARHADIDYVSMEQTFTTTR